MTVFRESAAWVAGVVIGYVLAQIQHAIEFRRIKALARQHVGPGRRGAGGENVETRGEVTITK